MSKIEIVFDNGKTSVSRTGCSIPEMLLASKILEVEAVKDINANNNIDVNSLIIGLETMLIPFSDEAKKNFDQENALKMLPVALKVLVDNYKLK